MDIFYVVFGLLFLVYEVVNNALKSLAASVGGDGVLTALICGFFALGMASHAGDKVKELGKTAEELEEKLAEEEEEEDW